MKRVQRLWPVRFLLDTARLCRDCWVTQSAAALAYFLLLTLFPLLLCVNYVVGLFHLDLEQLLLSVQHIFPQAVVRLLGDYLAYAAQNRSGAVFLAALGAMVLSACAGLGTLLHTLDRLHGRPPGGGLRRTALSAVLSVLFLLAIYLSAVVIVTGGWFFRLLEELLPQPLLALLPVSALSGIWLGLRYVLLYCFMLLLVLSVYWAGSPRAYRGWFLIGNAVVTSGALVACSAAFSWFVGMSSRYSAVYGSLASMIVLVMWLYFCGNILLVGAAAGRVLAKRLAKRRGIGYNRDNNGPGAARKEQKDRGKEL